MSIINFGLSFYIVQTEEDSYNLHNAMTDRKILFAERKENINEFLELNDPTHPFITPEDIIPEDNKTFEYTCECPSMKDLNDEYGLGMTDLNVSSIDNSYSTSLDSQISFVFVGDSEELNDNIEETDNVLPFLPEDEQIYIRYIKKALGRM